MRHAWSSLLAAASLLFADAALAQTPEEVVAIERVERIGRDIYEHDRAAWLATDAMLAEFVEAERARVRGWITQRDGDSVVVLFVADSEPLLSIYRAVFRNGVLSERGRSDAALNDDQVRLYRARQIARQMPVGCGGTYNSVTLVRDQGVVADIYLIPATTMRGVVRVGGFQRIAVDLDTGDVMETEPFSRSCLELDRDMSAQGVEAAGLFFTHLLSSTPTETHVFLSLSERLPLYVGAGGRVWRIHDGRVTLFDLERPN